MSYVSRKLTKDCLSQPYINKKTRKSFDSFISLDTVEVLTAADHSAYITQTCASEQCHSFKKQPSDIRLLNVNKQVSVISHYADKKKL